VSIIVISLLMKARSRASDTIWWMVDMSLIYKEIQFTVNTGRRVRISDEKRIHSDQEG